MNSAKKPLEGIKVLDLTHMLSGPYGGMILADLGCEVIKIEPPVKGEATRRLLENDPDYSFNGMGAYFYTLNRNKKSLALDLKNPDGLHVFYQLIKKADVVLSNFSAGVTAKLKIDFKELKKINPKIITCTVSGFGESGPNYQRPAFDQIAQALGGGMSITGLSASEPMRAGIPIGDLGGGMFAVMGIQAAIISRATSGEGQHVDISMLDCQISMLNYMATMQTMSGIVPTPIGNSHFVHMPYNSFATKDYPIVIAAVGDQFWPRLLKIFTNPELQDSKYITAYERQKDKEKLEKIMQVELLKEPSDYWLKRLEAESVPCARVNNLEQAINDEQINYRNMMVDVPHPAGGSAKVPGNPIKLSSVESEEFLAPPLLGEHTKEVLMEWLGYSEEELKEMDNLKIIEILK
ncbi:CoA transferase [Gammaproteobacteria bacterium]|nr:CoA transferase [Gammaproteobacteria bacterium]MDA9973696.1 CoA transferase [Gammaproteobacteria bacterium]MDB9700769.1 CoA transferase [Gammaproteobacteria bacterium]MDB9896536.1 CoA transferase [Gammaproteobacteria bacterium]MDC0091409.1 CoA transferase [Gammaproteobacteria bacterium]